MELDQQEALKFVARVAALNCERCKDHREQESTIEQESITETLEENLDKQSKSNLEAHNHETETLWDPVNSTSEKGQETTLAMECKEHNAIENKYTNSDENKIDKAKIENLSNENTKNLKKIADKEHNATENKYTNSDENKTDEAKIENGKKNHPR